MEGPGVGAEAGGEGGFAALAVLVAESVEAGAVVHLGEVGEFVVYDVVAEVVGEEDEGVAK